MEGKTIVTVLLILILLGLVGFLAYTNYSLNKPSTTNVTYDVDVYPDVSGSRMGYRYLW